MEKTEKEIYYDLDDLEDEVCKLGLMIQGYIYSVHQDTKTERQEEQLRSFSFDLQDRVSKLKNCFSKE